MKKNKLLMSVAMSFAAFASQLHADDSWEWSGPDGECYAYDDCCCESKVLVAAEFLWWTSGTYFPFANNVFVNDGNGVSSPSAPFLSETDTTLEPYTRISEKWSPGVRLGLGWENCEGDWQIWGVWTGYSNYARRVINSIPPSASSSPSNFGYLTTPIGAEVLTSTSLPPIGVTLLEQITGTNVTATHKLNYNVADLVFGKSFEPICDLQLMPYAGVRALFINQRDRVFFTGTSLEIATDIFASTGGSTRVEEELWGVGPRLGLEASWGEWCGFSLLGNISASILYGRLEEYVQTTNTFVPIQTETPRRIVTLNTHTRDRYNQIIPNLQVQLGLGYKIDFELNCSPYSVDIFAMWEGNTYWAASNFLFRERALGLNGLTTGFAFNW